MKFFQPTNKFIILVVILGIVVLVGWFVIGQGVFYKESELPVIDNLNTDAGVNGKNTGCVISGCSGQICAEEEMMSTCEFLPEYACYKDAVCERQASGQCGWTMSDELKSCLDNAKSRDFNNKLEVY